MFYYYSKWSNWHPFSNKWPFWGGNRGGSGGSFKTPLTEISTFKKQEVSDGKPTDTLPTNTILSLLKKKNTADDEKEKKITLIEESRSWF